MRYFRMIFEKNDLVIVGSVFSIGAAGESIGGFVFCDVGPILGCVLWYWTNIALLIFEGVAGDIVELSAWLWDYSDIVAA